MPDSPSAASTAAAAAMESGKHYPPRITHDSGGFLVLHGKFRGANKGADSEASLPVTLRVRRRASKLPFPKDSVKKRFFVCKLQIPCKIAKSIRIFSETLLTNCLSFGILIKLNRFSRANMAQSVEQRFRKPQVEGSSPSVGSLFEV